jgi:hypothetical protein
VSKEDKSRTYERARYTLPDVVDPDKRRCITIEIPDNIYHYAAFYGQILALSRAYSWGNDAAHTALAVAAVWRRVLETLRDCDEPPTFGGVDEGNEQLIRQNPDNPCLLETSINGTDWCVFADLSKCVPPGTQPGHGAPQPGPGGGQQCYHAQFNASNKWLLPTLVNAGDTLEITNATGAASDGTVVWFCPNGAVFQLGACFGSGSTSGGDPLPTAPHMTLVAQINGVYYNVYNTSLTVPGGVSAASVEFSVNDSSLSDNYGDLTFDVCVTNNQSATWTHTFDFTLSDGGFSILSVTTGVAAAYTPGVGWVNSDFELPANNFYRGAYIYKTFASRTITSIKMYYDLASHGTNQGGGSTELSIYESGVQTFASKTFTNMTDGNGQFEEFNGSVPAARIDLNLWSSYYGPTSNFAGSMRIYKLIVAGIGTDPF